MKRLIIVLTLISTPALAGGYNDENAAELGRFIERTTPPPQQYEPQLPETQHYYQRMDTQGHYSYEYLKRMD